MISKLIRALTAVIICCTCFACQKKAPIADTLFEELPATYTNITFVNKVEVTPEMNIFSYRNFYNGGGVAIGDVNNDNLPDIYFSANTAKNQLYLNKGNLQFQDITTQAGVASKQAWSTGVTMADVNGDNLLDIYVCNAGDVTGDNRKNELFINNGNNAQGIPVFTEKAAEYGLDDEGYSTHAAFFDYDRDGDLDVYLLNNSSYPVSRLGFNNIRNQRDKLGGQKLFRNDNQKFIDVSETAGIYGSLIGFGLGITIGDVNNDNWLDIFISNDFYERDYLYLNNQNGTFTEASKNWMRHESLSSMGADIADINNDGYLDIFVTDMLPGNDTRLKRTSQFESYDLEQLKLSRDFHYQYMQNMLHLNNGNHSFSEVARLAGVQATDWSWGALLFDMDNDGLKDIFVANGIYNDLTDQDFVNFLGNEETMRRAIEGGGYNYNQELIAKMTSTPISNYAFQNTGNLQFVNKAESWGLGKPNFSNGAAYGDLDNDGDLDLVVNNENTPVSVYKNKASEKLKNNFLRVKLQGTAKNRAGIGTKVYVHQPNRTLYLQQMPNRGFESSVDLTLVFGLGKEARIDSVSVVWPDDKMQVVKPVKVNQQLVLNYQNASKTFKPEKVKNNGPFYDATQQVKLNYIHRESNFVDYNRDGLLKQMLSTQGPALATGDVNGDSREDVYVGGAAGNPKKLFLQQANGTFAETTSKMFQDGLGSEDVDAVFFDADKDQDLDLYVVTGSNEFLPNAPELLDRFYLNDGKGNFTRDNRLPNLAENGSCVAAADFDQDGDVDLFIGSRMVSGSYGYDPPSYLYINDGTGNFKNYTKRYLPKNELGMITDAVWADINQDNFPELIIVGDWMPVMVFKNNQGRQLVSSAPAGIPNSAGWWNTIKPADVDGDGDLDFILGNLGKNTRIVASTQQPAELYTADFDGNGTVEQIISCYTEDGKAYPMVLKQDLQKQVPSIKKKFVKYTDYAGKQIQDIFPAEVLKTAVIKKVSNPNTSLLINQSNFTFALQALPLEAQFSPVFGINTLDYNQDGQLDILLTGNFFDVLPEIGRYDANYGLLLRGMGKGKFTAVTSQESGLQVQGQVRKTQQIIGSANQPLLILAKNNDTLQVLRYKK
ncbi:RNA-binding protein [Adhaeribacter arboris]|uniref:RNA-binding protein n=1 Tax=Adhaeribacter arboris TaxID=2072846 RepID=A0A2T2YIX5_9BACT|nr:VCBS repeat-containing protein [Adhaeribacter arboris]PSR55464.1 RNA-binding protein [Adhaeribacter arboris]